MGMVPAAVGVSSESAPALDDRVPLGSTSALRRACCPLDRPHGYGTGTTNASVVHLNGLAVNAALAELAAWLSGARPPAGWLDIDLLGNPKQPGIQIGPRQVAERSGGCIDCGAVSRSPRP